MEDEKFIKDIEIVENRELNIWEALFPVFALIAMLAYNVFIYGDASLGGTNQFILLLGGAIAAVVGFFNKVSFDKMIEEVAINVKSTTGAILILLLVGSLAGTWMISGIIPIRSTPASINESARSRFLIPPEAFILALPSTAFLMIAM